MTAESTADQFSYYTQARNYLFDAIIPEVTADCKQGKTAALILFLIERKAAGFHEVSAEVSIPDMEAFSNASRSDVRRARNWLIAEGYIEVISEGSGLETSNLRIVVDPNKRPAIREKQRDRSQIKTIRPASKPAKIISRPSETSDPTVRLYPQTASDKTQKSQKDILNQTPKGEEVPIASVSEAVEPPDPSTAATPETHESTSRIFQYESALEVSKIKGVLTDPPSRGSNVLSIPGDKTKTNKERAAENIEKKAAAAAVCSFVKSQSVKMEDRDYAFVKWAVNSYGAEVVLQKLHIAEFQAARRVKFPSPLGWLRSALARDYQHAEYDRQVVKARENSRREIERCKREKIEREAERAKNLRERKNPNAASEAFKAFLAIVGE